MVEQSLISYFPFKNMRKSQLKVLNEIEEAINYGYKQIIIEAATGFGKSPIAIAIAKYFGSSYICTSTINLQDQYKDDFRFLNKVMGKGNFRCSIKEEQFHAGKFKCKQCKKTNIYECKHAMVNSAPCLSKKFKCHYKTIRSDYNNDSPTIKLKDYLIDLQNDPEIAKARNYGVEFITKKIDDFTKWDHHEEFKTSFHPCEYFDQKNKGLFSNHSLVNYAVFLTFSSLTKKKEDEIIPYLPTKKILIMDEGHLLEEEIIKYNGEKLDINTIRWLTNNKDIFDMLPEYEKHNDWLDYLENIAEYIYINLAELDVEEDELIIEKERGRLDEDDEKRLDKLPRLMYVISDRFDKIKNVIDGLRHNPNNWIIDIEQSGSIPKVVFKPIDVTEYCKNLYKFGDYLLIMSATILDKEMYCKQIGLDKNTVKFISIDSEFPVENKPIFKEYVGKLNRKTMSDPNMHKNIATKLVSIMKEYNEVRGLIHMPNNKSIDDILPYINKINKTQYLRLKVVKDMTAEERKNMIDDFKRNPNSVFISPSLYVGIDLKDDLSRFQVIVKVPYASLGDKWVRTKFNLDKKWYEWQTTLKVIQGYGRSIRHSDDFCDTYLLDEQFESLFKYSFNLLPESFKDAIRFGAQNPEKKTLNRIPNILEVKDFR